MWTVEKELVKAISKIVVTEVAPEEISLFSDLADDCLLHPAVPSGATQVSAEVGFGLEAAAVITPAAIAMAGAVCEFVAGQVAQAFRDQTTEWIKKQVGALFARALKAAGASVEKPALSLSRQQLEEIDRVAREQGAKFGLKKDVSKRMAQAIVGTLATS